MDADSKIKVLLVDDHQIIQVEIGALLATLDGIELVAQGYDGREAIRLCDEYMPDVVLMDVSMPVMNGIIATRTITARHPTIKVIAMTGLDDSGIVQNMIQAGAVGYLLKESPPEDLASIIRAVHGGGSVFSPSVVSPLLNPSSPKHQVDLTARELQVLSLLAMGQTNGQIALKLGISQPTVRFHLNNILEKLGVETRSEALVLAARLGLV